MTEAGYHINGAGGTGSSPSIQLIRCVHLHTFRSSGENDSVQRAGDTCHRSDERQKWETPDEFEACDEPYDKELGWGGNVRV